MISIQDKVHAINTVLNMGFKGKAARIHYKLILNRILKTKLVERQLYIEQIENLRISLKKNTNFDDLSALDLSALDISSINNN
jgi:hypothetical protein